MATTWSERTWSERRSPRRFLSEHAYEEENYAKDVLPLFLFKYRSQTTLKKGTEGVAPQYLLPLF